MSIICRAPNTVHTVAQLLVAASMIVREFYIERFLTEGHCSRATDNVIKSPSGYDSCFPEQPLKNNKLATHIEDEIMAVKRAFPMLFVLLALVSNGANASLIGDEVTCSFTTIGVFSLNNQLCSTNSSSYTTGPRIVGSYTEFFPGLNFGGTNPVFIRGASVDVGADSILLFPASIITGSMGSFFLDIGSLDWVGEPDHIITGVVATAENLDLTKLAVTYTDHSVHLAIVDTVMYSNTRINVQLLSGLPVAVPVPSPLALAILGLGMLLLQRRRCPS